MYSHSSGSKTTHRYIGCREDPWPLLNRPVQWHRQPWGSKIGSLCGHTSKNQRKRYASTIFAFRAAFNTCLSSSLDRSRCRWLLLFWLWEKPVEPQFQAHAKKKTKCRFLDLLSLYQGSELNFVFGALTCSRASLAVGPRCTRNYNLKPLALVAAVSKKSEASLMKTRTSFAYLWDHFYSLDS